MSSAAHPALAMLRAGWQWRRNDGSLWALRLYALVLALLFGVPAVAALLWLPPHQAALSVGALAVTGLCLAWGAQFAALLRLDHPHAVHGVPGYARALRTAALGPWAVLVAVSATVAGLGAALLQVGDIGTCWRLALGVALAIGTLLLFVAAAMRWWGLWVVASVVPVFFSVHAWRHFMAGLGGWALQLWQAQPLGSTLGVLLAQALLLCAVFGNGQAAHARAYARRERSRRVSALVAAGQSPPLASYGPWGEWLSLPGQKLADAWLRHCLRRAQPQPGSVMDRAELVLHGSQHWVRQLAVLLFVQLSVAASIVVTAALVGLRPELLLAQGRGGITIGLSFMAFSVILALPGALWASRREQGLLMLLPGMPQGAALNRALAWRQARHCLLLWLALLPAVASVLWAGQAPPTLALLGMVLPLGAWLWRDHARMQGPRPVTVLPPLVLCLPAGALSMFLLSRHPAALGPWALGVLALTAALLAWRWRVLQRLPQALPVGRLG